MDLNDFIFRDDTAEPLGACADDADEIVRTDETAAPAKLGLAVIGSAVLGLSNFLGHATKNF